MPHVRAIELWRPVVGFEGAYEVSNCGGVRSVARVVRLSTGRVCRYRSRLLRPYRHVRDSRWMVTLSGRTYRYVHVLVLESFVGPRPDGLKGLHADDNTWNNHLSNLRWGSSAENSQDCVRNGHHRGAQLESCSRGHALVAPNLVESQLPGRDCKACARAAAALFKRGESRTSELMQELSDERYARVLAGR